VTPFLAVDPVALIRSPLLLLLLLLPLVIIHELGHFFSAKAFGVKVLEFGIGFPPRIKGLVWKRGETEYTINWLPIGGFVRLLGEEDGTDPRSLAAQAPWKRLIVIYSGVAINFVAAVALFSFGFMLPRERSLSLAQITYVEPGSPAAEAQITGVMQDGSEPLQGLQPGDIVLEAEGREIANTAELVYANRLNLGEAQDWVIKRGNSILEADVYARWDPPEGQGPTGVLIGAPATCTGVDDEGNATNCQLLYPFTETVQHLAPWAAIDKGWQQLVDTVVLTKNELQVRLGGGTEGASLAGEDAPVFSGPVGIANTTNQLVSDAGWRPLIEMAGLLSLSLAVFNFLPIPGLDGGRALFIWIELVRGGRRISAEREGLIHLAGLALLFAVFIVVTVEDVRRLIA
jgi:regulator of sigma E protease